MGAVSSFASLEAELRRVTLKESAAPEPGYRTTREWAAHWKISAAHAQKKIAAFRAAGLMEHKPFQRDCGLRLYPVPHYREVTKRCGKSHKPGICGSSHKRK